MTEPRKSRRVLFLVVGIVVAIGIAAAVSIVAIQARANAARDSYSTAETSVIKQVEADDDAHAALNAVETSSFADDATKVVTSLTACMGEPATSITTTGLDQLAGFAASPGAPRDILSIPNAQAGYLADAKKLLAELAADKVRTAETKAAAESNLIAQDEVNQDLDAIAVGIGGTSVKLVSKDTYATGAVKDAYKKSVAGVATAAAQVAPSLTAKRTVKITAPESAALISSLTTFADECNAEAKSSKAHKPKPVVHGVASPVLSLSAQFWPVGNIGGRHFDLNFNIDNSTFGLGCKESGVLAQGTTSGPHGGTKTINVEGNGKPVRVLKTWLAPTTVKWAVVYCNSAN